MRRVGLLLLTLALVGGPALEARAGAEAALAPARAALARQRPRDAIALLARGMAAPGFAQDPAAPQALMLLAEASERHVKAVNDRYWQRSRLDPRAPSWLAYVRAEQRWAGQRAAGFSYYEPRGRYRYDGDAYRLLVRRHPRHPLAEEAAWRLIGCEADGEHREAVDPALLDASRHERFLRKYPRSHHRLAARVAIGWDYLYASGFTWGPPLRSRFLKGQRILEAVVQEAPTSAEAARARQLLARAQDPFGAGAVPPERRRGS